MIRSALLAVYFGDLVADLCNDDVPDVTALRTKRFNIGANSS